MPWTQLDRRMLAAWAACAAVGTPGCEAQESPFDGTYSVAYAGGNVMLAIQTLPSGEVRGWLEGGDARFELEGLMVTDEEGAATIEGTLAGAGLRSDFSLYRQDDGSYAVLITPYDPAGVARADQAAVHVAARIDTEPPASAATGSVAADPTAAAPSASAPAASPQPPSGDRDPRLIGIWSSQVIMNSPAGSIATELRMQFGADGVMRDLGSRTLGGVAGGSFDTGFENGTDHAVWRTEGDMLLISYDGSPWVTFARFEVSDRNLLLTYVQDGSRQLWSRMAGG